MNPGRRFTVFSTDGFGGVKNLKYMFSEFLCCVCGLIRRNLWLFLWFLICGWVQGLQLSLVNFQFFNSHFPVTTLGLDLFSGAYLNNFTLSVVSID